MRETDKTFIDIDIPLDAEEVVVSKDVYAAYTAAQAEIEEGKLDMGVWTRSFAMAGGDQEKAQSLYIESRVKSIMDGAVFANKPPQRAKPAVIKGPQDEDEDEDEASTDRVNLVKLLSKNPYVIGLAAAIIAALGWWGYSEYAMQQTVAASAAKNPVEKAQKPREPDKVVITRPPAPVQKPVAPGLTVIPARPVDSSKFKPAPPASRLTLLPPRDPPSFSVSLEQAVAAISGEIGGAYNRRMIPTIAKMEGRYPVFRTAAGRVAVQRLKNQIDAKLAELARLEAPSGVPDDQVSPKPGFSATVQSDLDATEARAMKNYPYLATPPGKVVMERIIERRDELIQQGVYPSIALTQAVNSYAPANAPAPPKERDREPPPNPLIDSGNHSGFPARCRWVTPQDWSCK